MYVAWCLQDILVVGQRGLVGYHNPGPERWPQVYVMNYTFPMPSFRPTVFFNTNVGFKK
jgi:hypothetical protein